MAVEGMDVEQVTSVLKQVSGLQGQMQGQLSTLQGAVNGLSAHWIGQDASAFHSSWTADYYNPLHSAVTNLQGLISTLQSNVNQQSTASGS